MAAPLSDQTLVSILRDENVKLREVPGWQKHNRNPGRAWGPINGVMVHHTGSNTSGNGEAYNRNILWSGYSGLPGPLCHFGVAPDGTVWLNSNGRANHAGGGDPNVLTKVVAESYSALKPAIGNSGGTDGNRHFYGLEVMYSGGSAMSSAQHDSVVRICAAICRHYGWSAKSTIGHREWSADKWDPGATDMDKLRADVQRQIDATTTAQPAPATPTDPLEEIMGWYDSKKDFEQAIREAVQREAPRATMKSHASLDGGVITETVAAAIRRDQTIGRQNRAKLNQINTKLDTIIAALKDAPQAAAGLGPAVFDIAASVAKLDADDQTQEQATVPEED